MNSNINVLEDAMTLLNSHGFEVNYEPTVLPGIDLGLNENQAVATIKITDRRNNRLEKSLLSKKITAGKPVVISYFIIFKTKGELLKQLMKDKAYKDFIKWVKAQETLEDVFNGCRLDWRVWALTRSYVQFEKELDECDWAKLGGWDWARLLRWQPQFADKCDWAKLDGWDWVCLLRAQPQFADKCDWAKLSGGGWVLLLIKQPQLEKYRS